MGTHQNVKFVLMKLARVERLVNNGHQRTTHVSPSNVPHQVTLLSQLLSVHQPPFVKPVTEELKDQARMPAAEFTNVFQKRMMMKSVHQKS